VQAGVATIEHGFSATEESLAPMRDRGVALCPTLATAEAIAVGAGWDPSSGAPEPERLRQAKAAFARARELGVTIACGTDAGVFQHGDNAREIELMVAGGMTPAEALRAATSTAARILGRGFDPANAPARDGPCDRTALPFGTIAEGCAADLVALDADPLRDVGSLRRPSLVLKDGEIAAGSR
jgi:imidazolonepropionase-like amidohydrolase